MRKWRDLAFQNDPESWYAVSNMVPNQRGAYELAYVGTSGDEYAATGATAVAYAFAAKTLTGTREYVIDAAKIWEWNGASLTDRTNGVAVGGKTAIQMAQYGNVTICVMGTSNPTVSSTGGNFSALAGAPQGEIVCVQSNAVLVFNTSTNADGWAASDVGDYTNWTTGEATSGRIIATPGPITAAIAYGNDVLVFKPDAIYRMTYVGGVVKWAVQLVWRGLGIISTNASVEVAGKHQAVATARGVAFCGNGSILGTTQTADIYLFDGVSEPRKLNPDTSIKNGSYNVFGYNPIADVLTLAPQVGSSATGTAAGDTSLYYYYNFKSDAWGSGVGSAAEVDASGNGGGHGTVQGDWNSSPATNITSKTAHWTYRVADKLTRSGATQGASCYLQSSKYGRSDGITTFSRLIPLLRRRSDLGTDSVTLTLELFNELEDTSATTTRSGIAESTNRKRFDLLGGASSAPFGRFKVTWTALDVEVDDFLVKSSFAPEAN